MGELRVRNCKSSKTPGRRLFNCISRFGHDRIRKMASGNRNLESIGNSRLEVRNWRFSETNFQFPTSNLEFPIDMSPVCAPSVILAAAGYGADLALQDCASDRIRRDGRRL